MTRRVNRQLLFAALLIMITTSASAATLPDVRVRWNGCDPNPQIQYFDGPRTYRLVVSASQFAGEVEGVDVDVLVHSYLPIEHYCADPIYGPPADLNLCVYPDAWRFADGGCQGLSRLSLSQSAA